MLLHILLTWAFLSTGKLLIMSGQVLRVIVGYKITHCIGKAEIEIDQIRALREHQTSITIHQASSSNVSLPQGAATTKEFSYYFVDAMGYSTNYLRPAGLRIVFRSC